MRKVWKCFVFPGVAETATRLAESKAFIVDDLPTFGYPTSPTVSGRACNEVSDTLSEARVFLPESCWCKVSSSSSSLDFLHLELSSSFNRSCQASRSSNLSYIRVSTSSSSVESPSRWRLFCILSTTSPAPSVSSAPSTSSASSSSELPSRSPSKSSEIFSLSDVLVADLKRKLLSDLSQCQLCAAITLPPGGGQARMYLTT